MHNVERFTAGIAGQLFLISLHGKAQSGYPKNTIGMFFLLYHMPLPSPCHTGVFEGVLITLRSGMGLIFVILLS